MGRIKKGKKNEMKKKNDSTMHAVQSVIRRSNG